MLARVLLGPRDFQHADIPTRLSRAKDGNAPSDPRRRGRARVRLHQRVPRRSQLGGDGGRDPRAVTACCAVAWAAFFNFVAFVIIPLKVANTIAKDVVDPASNALTIGVVFAGLVGAIAWNLITAWLGLPTSSSHALVGGMAGAAVARAGGHVLVIDGIRKILVFIVLAPLIGLALALHAARS